MPKYKVLKPGFFGGVFRTPGGPHDPVITAQPFKKGACPSWLELLKTPAKKKKPANDTTVPNDTLESITDINPDDNDSGVETL